MASGGWFFDLCWLVGATLGPPWANIGSLEENLLISKVPRASQREPKLVNSGLFFCCGFWGACGASLRRL